jgi:putative membrane-bound dehydrogenase-like protein
MFRLRLFLPILTALPLSARPLAAQEAVVDKDIAVSSALRPGLVKHPVMAALDDRGRLFVAANAGVNLNKEELLKETPSSIHLLEDTDKDGVFDKSTLFADKMTFPQGALWVYDSLYVMSPPSLWRLADEDGDGRAEVREELATGFDFTGNAADVHGPFLHPNGRLFWCHGRKGFVIRDGDTGQVLEQGKSARIWSSQLGGGEVESFAGGGMDNPVEIDFTDTGELIGSVNLFYGRPRGDVLVHWVHGGVYPRFDMGQVVAELRRTGDLLPDAHNFGHVAVSGMCRYRSGALDPDWTDGWITTHFNTGELTLTKLETRGSTFAGGETSTIFRALKPDTHLTDVLEDRNGDLLVIDTGGWFRSGCPTSQIAKPEIEGTIYRLSKKDNPYRAATYPDWNQLTAEQVSHFLSAPEDWLRERAITELAVRGAPAMPELERILTGGQADATARINAVWTLARMKFSESTDLIYGALTDPEAGVRQAACNALSVTRTWQIVAANQPAERNIELERNATLSGALAGIVRGDDAAVARSAAAALGRMGESRAIGTLTGRLGRSDGDRFLQHALVYALIEIDDFDATREGLKAADPAVISGTLRALDGMASSKLEVLDVLPHLETVDAGLRETALSVALNHREWDAALANAFFDWHGAIDEKRRAILQQVVPAFADSPPMVDYLTSLVASKDEPHELLGLELIARSAGIPFQEEWVPLFEKALAAGAGPGILATALEALQTSRSDRFAAALASICGDRSRGFAQRLAAARALVVPKSPIAPAAFDLAEGILGPGGPAEHRGAAIDLLARSTLSAAERDRLAPLLKSFGPVEWGAFPDLFRSLDTPAQADAVADALVSSTAIANFEPDLLRKRFEKHPDALAKVSERIAELGQEREGRSGRIAELVKTLDQADPANGEKVFTSGKGACLVCHRVGETGGQIGPDLSTIGRIRTGRDLYESVLYPSESIARDFDTYEVTVKSSGQVRVGVIHEQTARGLALVNPGGQREDIPHDDVANLRRLPTSLMPMGLEQTLAPEELRDLVAWLLSRK